MNTDHESRIVAYSASVTYETRKTKETGKCMYIILGMIGKAEYAPCQTDQHIQLNIRPARYAQPGNHPAASKVVFGYDRNTALKSIRNGWDSNNKIRNGLKTNWKQNRITKCVRKVTREIDFSSVDYFTRMVREKSTRLQLCEGRVE